jgi:hypothetical protein
MKSQSKIVPSVRSVVFVLFRTGVTTDFTDNINSPGNLDFSPGGIQNLTADYADGADELAQA